MLTGRKNREERGREKDRTSRHNELPPLQVEEVNLSGQGGSDPVHREEHLLYIFLKMS